MVRISRRTQYAFLALAAGCVARAQLTNLPDLEDATTAAAAEPTAPADDDASETTAEADAGSAAEPTPSADDDASETTADPDASSAAGTTAEATAIGGESASDESTPTDAETTIAEQSASAGTTAAPTPVETTEGATSASNSIFHLTGVPTIAGAGIPELVIPYTAGAPFMQKSTLPEGTVFIVVGAVLAFLGACVLLWRAMIAWSINRSVRRSALASIRGSEKNGSVWGGGTYQPAKKNGSFYHDPNGSSMSLDNLTSAGKPIKANPFRDHEDPRKSAQPTANLFFSPTAGARNSVVNLQSTPNWSSAAGNRSSSHLPAGYYASPAAAPPTSATLGNPHLSASNINPYNRNSHYSMTSRADHSPPPTPYRNSSRDGGAPPPAMGGAGLRPPSSRDGPQHKNSYIESARQGHNNTLYAAPSSSSLMVGTGGTTRPGSSGGAGTDSDLGGSRAPSAYLDEIFDNHGNGPMRGL